MKSCEDCKNWSPSQLVDEEYCQRGHHTEVKRWVDGANKALSVDPDLLVDCSNCPGFEAMEGLTA